MATESNLIEVYGEVTINGEKPIDGSVSMSVSTESQTKLKYEGGTIAGFKSGGDPEVTLSWKTPGATAEATSTKGSATIADDKSNSITIDGILTSSPSWDSSWGFVTEYSCVGKVGTSS